MDVHTHTHTHAHTHTHTTARGLGKACGKLISAKFVLGDIVQLKTRNLYKVVEN